MFKVPASKRFNPESRFAFSVDGGEYTLPLLKYVPVEAAEAMEEGRNVKAILLAADSEPARAALRALDGEQLEALSEAWAEASGISVGESAASPTS